MKKIKFYYEIFENGLDETANSKWIGGPEHYYFKTEIIPNLPKDVGFFRHGNTGIWYTFDAPLPDYCMDKINSAGSKLFKYIGFEEVDIEPKFTKLERDSRYTKKIKNQKKESIKFKINPKTGLRDGGV